MLDCETVIQMQFVSFIFDVATIHQFMMPDNNLHFSLVSKVRISDEFIIPANEVFLWHCTCIHSLHNYYDCVVYKQLTKVLYVVHLTSVTLNCSIMIRSY